MALTDFLFERYDVPKSSIAGHVSQAFENFVTDVFVYSRAHGLVLDGMSPAEVELAKDLIRRNLQLGYTHLLSAAAVLEDQAAVPQLEALLTKETALAHRAQIARCLLAITQDPKYEQASREWEELGPDRQQELIKTSLAASAACPASVEFRAFIERERDEMSRARSSANRHALVVALVVAVVLALIASVLALCLIR